MPELPEVETIKRGLASRLLGARLDAVNVRERRLRHRVSPRALRGMVGSTFVSIERRAKYIVMTTDAGESLVVHLGMSGRLLMHEGEPTPIERHDHVIWRLSQLAKIGRRIELRYRDPRRFGVVVVIPAAEIGSHRLFAGLGREPLVDVDATYLAECARGTRRPIKNFLMDASIVVGVGNIYASETLWHARVHPATAAGRIRLPRWQRIVDSMRHVLESAIAAGGTTLIDYRDADGNLGYFASELRVYGRAAEACDRCGGTIRRKVDAGRSTYYCGRCQR